MKKNLIWGIALLVLAIIFIVMARLGGSGPGDGNGLTADLTPAVTEADWIKGDPEASVTLVEYGDFQCPACAAYAPLVGQLLVDFPTGLRIVWRHFPLRQIHPNAQLAAQAAETAGLSGKFWQMHDKLFATQTTWAGEANPRNQFSLLAREIGLDLPRFEIDLDQAATKEGIDEDYRQAARMNLSGTPTFFLNGKKINNPKNYEEFNKLIKNSFSENP